MRFGPVPVLSVLGEFEGPCGPLLCDVGIQGLIRSSCSCCLGNPFLVPRLSSGTAHQLKCTLRCLRPRINHRDFRRKLLGVPPYLQ
ncbi:hypothetical protein HPB50_013401 [Hyalomma asiaticum]|uniref:Uncharacterized protein n=1 Tax=Hyalomma asiaticum TaxID=266040 RepID=A0ACB7RKQ7_HYAAI|nr:hypothetical protein HPB50_013401 [Hyalomma asiaticum]